MTVASMKILVSPLVLGRAKSSLPYLALGMLAAHMRKLQFEGQLDEYEIGRLLPAGYIGRPLDIVYKKVMERKEGIYLFSSYVWNHDLNLEVAEHIKQLDPGAFIIFGGPHVPKYDGETEAFLQQHPYIDVAVIGEGEVTIVELLTALSKAGRGGLHNVAGIVYSSGSIIKRTEPRDRKREINAFPSPYLSGEFDPWFESFDVTVLETNRGCPYGCTYCDWGSATLEKVTKFTTTRVIAEIEYLARKKAGTIFIADANFGMLEQDIEIAEALVAIKAKYGFPQRLASNFAKNGGRRLMAVIKILHEGGLLPIGIIALQTTAPDVLKAIKRDNIRTESYEKMMSYFNSENIPMASDLMIGLPGQTVDSFEGDLQFCFDWKVLAAANYTSMMPNAPMAEQGYRSEHMIITDKNNMVESTASFSAGDMKYMKSLYTTYMFHVKFGVLIYILYYLQLEHGVAAIRFLRRWLDSVIDSDPALPLSGRVYREIFSTSRHDDWAILSWKDNAEFLFTNIEAYYAELLDFAELGFGVTLTESVRSTLLKSQQAVIPKPGRAYPYEVVLEHDIDSYIKQLKGVPSVDELDGELQLLSEFDSGSLIVANENTSVDTAHLLSLGSHAGAWELESPLRFY